MKLAVEVYCIFLHNAGIKADGWTVVSAWVGGGLLRKYYKYN